MKKVSIVKEKMDEWKKNANDILERVMVNDLNHKPLKEY